MVNDKVSEKSTKKKKNPNLILHSSCIIIEIKNYNKQEIHIIGTNWYYKYSKKNQQSNTYIKF